METPRIKRPFPYQLENVSAMIRRESEQGFYRGWLLHSYGPGRRLTICQLAWAHPLDWLKAARVRYRDSGSNIAAAAVNLYGMVLRQEYRVIVPITLVSCPPHLCQLWRQDWQDLTGLRLVTVMNPADFIYYDLHTQMPHLVVVSSHVFDAYVSYLCTSENRALYRLVHDTTSDETSRDENALYSWTLPARLASETVEVRSVSGDVVAPGQPYHYNMLAQKSPLNFASSSPLFGNFLRAWFNLPALIFGTGVKRILRSEIEAARGPLFCQRLDDSCPICTEDFNKPYMSECCWFSCCRKCAIQLTGSGAPCPQCRSPVYGDELLAVDGVAGRLRLETRVVVYSQNCPQIVGYMRLPREVDAQRAVYEQFCAHPRSLLHVLPGDSDLSSFDMSCVDVLISAVGDVDSIVHPFFASPRLTKLVLFHLTC
jgi:hypothetical protein